MMLWWDHEGLINPLRSSHNSSILLWRVVVEESSMHGSFVGSCSCYYSCHFGCLLLHDSSWRKRMDRPTHCSYELPGGRQPWPWRGVHCRSWPRCRRPHRRRNRARPIWCETIEVPPLRSSSSNDRHVLIEFEIHDKFRHDAEAVPDDRDVTVPDMYTERYLADTTMLLTLTTMMMYVVVVVGVVVSGRKSAAAGGGGGDSSSSGRRRLLLHSSSRMRLWK
jgi:hypothetical protein